MTEFEDHVYVLYCLFVDERTVVEVTFVTEFEDHVYVLYCLFVDERTVVEVTFVTEFEDHIYVAMDAEVILFIHDLIFMYIKEKDKGK